MANRGRPRVVEPVHQEPPIISHDVAEGDPWEAAAAETQKPATAEPKADPLKEAQAGIEVSEQQVRAFSEGLAKASAELKRRRSELEMLRRPPERDRRFWPEGTPMPQVYERRQTPCQGCRRVLMDDGGQAVVCMSSGGKSEGQTVAWFRCRVCGHRFKLPVVASSEKGNR